MMTLEAVRRQYAIDVCSVAAPAIASAALIEAFARVPREQFMNAGPWHIMTPAALVAALRTAAQEPKTKLDPNSLYESTPDARAEHLYADVLVSIDDTRHLNNGQPSSHARWISSVAPQPGESVLHIGCGTGYYAAILAELVGEHGKVVALEVDRELAARAKASLQAWPHARVDNADASALHELFDVVYVNAGATHAPREWLLAMKPGARMFLPLTVHMPLLPDNHGMGMALVITRTEGSVWPARIVSPVGIYDCSGARDADAEAQLREALKPEAAQRIAAISGHAHERTERCLVHVDGFCLQARV